MKRSFRKSSHPLWADVPVEQPSDDQLGRAQFAATVANSIRSMKGIESFVFGICGPWGCGKSSVLRMIVRDLARSRSKNKPTVVNFNPWWFSGQEQLLSGFLGQLAVVLGREDTGAAVSKLGERLTTLAKVLRPLGWIPGAGLLKDVGDVIADGSEAAKRLGDRLAADVHSLRSDIDEVLKKSKRRIVIVMDDIDRLTATEIAQLFAIVKAVADFPNTVYLLSFDHSVVCDAIRDKLGLDGGSYLEKIVQIHIDVPPPSAVILQQMFLQQLDGLIPAESVNQQSRKDFGNLFHDGLKSFFETPRSVKRLSNVLRVLFPSIAGEVYWPEFITITALQVFIPTAYRIIRDNRDHFIGSIGHSWDQTDREQAKAFQEKWLQTLPPHLREVATDLVKRLFPKASSALGGSIHGPDWESRWKAELRLCSSECFDRYFQFHVPEGAMSEAEWREFLTLLPTPDLAHDRILQYCQQPGPNRSTSRAKELLDRALVFAKHGSNADEAKALFISLLRCGDLLVAAQDSERVSLISIDNELRLQWALLELLERIPSDAEREQWLEQSIPRAALVPITKLVWFLGGEHGRFGEERNRPHEPPHVSEACVDRLLPLVVTKLQQAAADGSLGQHPKALALARDWRIFDISDAAQQWVNQVSQDEQFLVKLLFSAQSKTASHSGDDRVVTEGLSAGADFLLTWFDGVDLRNRCQSILDRGGEWQTEEAKAALRLVISSIDNEGKALDPFRLSRRAPQREIADSESPGIDNSADPSL